MTEAGALIGKDGEALYWHQPPDANVVALPDSRALWSAIWELREYVAGFAHTHPGRGRPSPSGTDLGTFSAIEGALGRRLDWWIASADGLAIVRWDCESECYLLSEIDCEPGWLAELRSRSKF